MAHVLIIDDSSTIIMIVKSMLEEAGHTTFAAANGKLGLDYALNNAMDAIILDRQMPEMDGNQVLIELKADKKTKEIPVIMLTKDSNINDISSCLELGASDYVVKPFDKDNLLIRLNKAIAAQS